MQLSELISVLPFADIPSDFKQIDINKIEVDSRKVKEGSLFICIRGFTTDGHHYVHDAVTNGATAVITEENISLEVPSIKVSDTTRALAMLVNKFYNYPTAKLPLIGVTGTNGKTTVAYLLDAIYQSLGKKTGVIGTIQTKLGDASYPTANTTPDSLSLQRLFKQMEEEEVEQVIMEVSSHALDLGRVYGCDFDTAVFTNLSQDHLDYHHNEYNYLRVKSLLFAQLGNTYNGTSKAAVINADDPTADILKRTTAQTVLMYGIENEADVMAEDIQLFPDRTIFRLKTPRGTVKITSRLVGKFNIYNMLAASAAAIANQIPLETIKEAFRTLPMIPGRFETIDAGQDYTVLVDYAHTPDALRNILKTSREFTTGKIYVVFGCGGDRDSTKRSQMANEAIQNADYAIFTADNPRMEDPQAIIDDMITYIDSDVTNFEVILDRKSAIMTAVGYAMPSDMVIIAGKGHETYQEIKGKKYPFDDRVVARNAILA